MSTHCLWLVGPLVLCLHAACYSGEDAVSRTEFEQFKAQVLDENARLKAVNAQLKQDVERLKQWTKPPPIESKLNFVTMEEFQPVKLGLDKLRAGTTKFLLSGYASAGFEERATDLSTFTNEFNLVFLWKLSDRISFYTESLYADLSYVVNDDLTIHAGRVPAPFGYFAKNQRPPWINKLPDFPLFTALVPFSITGIMANGARDAGPTQFNWSVAASNGPRSQHKDVSGRLGFLPIPELELGGSIHYGRTGAKDTPLADANTLLVGADLSFVKVVDALKGTVDLRFEWAWSDVYGRVRAEEVLQNRHRDGGYAQLAYRPSLIEQKWVKNLECAIRYEHVSAVDEPSINLPVHGSLTSVSRDRWSLGLNYWLGSSTVLKFAFETDNEANESFLFQYAIGF